MLADAQQSPITFADRIRLPLAFDARGSRADLDGLAGIAWTDHLVTANYEGDWSVLPLRHAASATHPVMQIYSDPTVRDYVDGPLLAHAPHIRAALATFACPLQSVRLMRLSPGSRIKEHRDHDLAAEWGMARIHVPITTNPGVTFLLNREPVIMVPGEAWYLRLSDPHAVSNRGAADRVHLVIDAVVNDWLRAQLAIGQART